MTEPFLYPDGPHVRCHGPIGYAGAMSFRPWLRDEFAFRCVFCLQREAWGRVDAIFDLDHLRPISSHPSLVLVYDNMLYTCTTCNLAKQDREVPDPCKVLLRAHLQLDASGVLTPRTPDATRTVNILNLNRRRAVEHRKLWMEIVRLARAFNPDLYRRLMGFPDDLPDLSRLSPPGGNSRPNGVEQSYLIQRQRGTLPATY
jgi:hypothetical protein